MQPHMLHDAAHMHAERASCSRGTELLQSSLSFSRDIKGIRITALLQRQQRRGIEWGNESMAELHTVSRESAPNSANWESDLTCGRSECLYDALQHGHHTITSIVSELSFLDVDDTAITYLAVRSPEHKQSVWC